MNNKKRYILGLILVTMFFIMISLYLNVLFMTKSYVIINGKKEIAKEVELNELVINPGICVTTSLKFVSTKSINYNIGIIIGDNEKSELTNYVNLKIFIDNELICDNRIIDLVNKNLSICSEKYIDKFKPINIDFVYSIPEDVGNEIEGKKLKVDIKLLIRKIG